MSKSYNGWANYETWNVALWIGTDEGLYALARGVKRYGYKAFQECIKELEGAIASHTPDGISWTDARLDIDALDELLSEL